MGKRELFYAEVERLKELYRRDSTDALEARLRIGHIKACNVAAKAVLAERESGGPIRDPVWVSQVSYYHNYLLHRVMDYRGHGQKDETDVEQHPPSADTLKANDR